MKKLPNQLSYKTIRERYLQKGCPDVTAELCALATINNYTPEQIKLLEAPLTYEAQVIAQDCIHHNLDFTEIVQITDIGYLVEIFDYITNDLDIQDIHTKDNIICGNLYSYDTLVEEITMTKSLYSLATELSNINKQIYFGVITSIDTKKPLKLESFS